MKGMAEKKNGSGLAAYSCLVAGGRGIKSKEDFQLLGQLAEKLGGALCVSRPIVEKGWFPKEMQVGLNGKRVSPKLYVAVGISGAFQHVVGMRGAEYVVAINTDQDAGIFDVADCGIVGDYREVIPRLLEGEWLALCSKWC